MSFDLLDGEASETVGKRVKIFRNGDSEDGKDMVLSPEWTTNAFLLAAGRRLVLHAKRIFLVDGTEVEDIMVVEDDETLFISQGEDFLQPEKAGACISGYEVLEMLGKGGFGEVRLGRHVITKQTVALKFMSKASLGSAGAAERVATEIHCLTALHHPGVIRMYKVINQVDFTVLVFEYAAGGDLFNYVTQSAAKRLTEAEARHIFRQILSAVAYAHNHNICHGDLKLENILLSSREVTGYAPSSSSSAASSDAEDGEEATSHRSETPRSRGKGCRFWTLYVPQTGREKQSCRRLNFIYGSRGVEQ